MSPSLNPRKYGCTSILSDILALLQTGKERAAVTFCADLLPSFVVIPCGLVFQSCFLPVEVRSL